MATSFFGKWKERSAARKASKAGAGYFPKPAEAAPTGTAPAVAAPAETPVAPVSAPAPVMVENEGVTLRAAEPRTAGRPAKKAAKTPVKKAAAKKAPAKKAAAKAPAKKTAAAKKAPAKKAPAKKAAAGTTPEPAVVRAWAISTGYPVAPRGRISQETYAAYAAAK